MRAKPAKCRALAAKFFKGNDQRAKWKPFQGSTYATFDPQLTIKGQLVKAIGAPDGDQSFKFLGWIVYHDQNDKEIRAKVWKAYVKNMELVDATRLTGIQKAWIYQHFVVPKLNWPFLIYDFPLKLAKDMRTYANRALKNWIGLYKSADLGVLYRKRQRFGLQLTDIAVFFKKMQITKCAIVKHSPDKDIAQTYILREKYEARRKSMIWKPTMALAEAERQASFERRYRTGPLAYKPGQGLGTGTASRNLGAGRKSRREHAVSTLTRNEQERMLTHTASLAQQGVWTHWNDCVPFPLPWHQLIHKPPKLISFVLSSFINSARTPDMLKLWGYKKSAECSLCKKEQCTLAHIITGCRVALRQKRYTWRHDSVLKTLEPFLKSHIDKQNKSVERPKPLQPIDFVSKGEKPKALRKQLRPHLLQPADDWKLLIDYDNNPIVFPPEVYATDLRPDIIIFSLRTKTIIWAELTCPAEENISAAKIRKTKRYAELADQCRDQDEPWSVHPLTIEAGARGCVARSFRIFLRKIGFTTRKTKKVLGQVAMTTARCSYAIYLGATNIVWQHHALIGGAAIPQNDNNSN